MSGFSIPGTPRSTEKTAMKKKIQIVIKIIIPLISIATTALLCEVVFRVLLFSKAPFMERWRDPSLYADYYSDDDYWKLYYLFDGPYKPPENPHELLGWVGDFDRKTYRHNEAGEVRDRTPVLLYGDSFAACATSKQECFQGILNSDEEFNRKHYLLNYGVGGYGVDQICLLLKNSVDNFERPFVIMTLMTLDLDRSILSVRTGQKPYFDVRDDKLMLRGAPINPHPDDFFNQNPPKIKSYILRLLARGDDAQEDPEKREKKIRINRNIILEIKRELEKRQIPYLFLIFHPFWQIDTAEEWRDTFLTRLLVENGIPFLSSKEVVRKDAEATNKTGSDKCADYFDPDHQHPTPLLNKILAGYIKEYILKNN